MTWLQERKTVWVFNTYTGAYESKPANNPAWACYDILHHCRKIGDEYVVKGAPRERFVYDAFKAWADKCDEKHITFNYIYDSASQVWDALKYAENVGRGKVIPLGTRFSCIYDYAATPTQLFTVGNIKMDSFMEEFQATSSRANAIEVSFLNKAKDYERDVLPVFSEEYDVTTSLASPAQVELMGCDNVDQAYNYAKHYLRANKYEVRTCTFEAFTDAIACTIGDVILLQHDVTDWGQGGRIVSATGNKVVLDRDVTFEQGKTYRLMVRNATTDALESYDVASASGNTLTLAKSVVVQTDDLYTYGEATKEAKPFRVLSISKSNSEMTRKISCIEYYPELYAGDDGSVPIIDYTTQSDVLKVINLVLLADTKTLKDGTVLCDINGTWQLPRGKVAKNIIVYYKPVTTQEWQQFKVLDGSATSVTIPSVATDVNYDVKIVCTNEVGAAYEGVERAVYVSGKEIPPATPKGFKVTQDAVNSSVLHLSWEPNTEADLHGYTLYDGNDVVLIKHIGGTSYSYFIPNTGNYQFKLSAVDTSGNESGKAEARITATVSAESVATPNAPARGEVTIGKTIVAAWDPVENTYIDYYEVRLDSNVGQANNRLAKTTDIRSEIKLSARRGAVFVYAHNPVKGYGPALRLDYNAVVPKAPTNVKVKGNITGVSVVFDGIPDTCIGANIYIGTEKYFVTTNVNIIPHDPGVFDVKVAYVDVFGEGAYSNIVGTSVPASIDTALIDKEALGIKAMDDKIKELTQTANAYSTQVQNLTTNMATQFSQLSEGIDLKLKALNGDEIVSRINLSSTGTRISGKLLHVTGDALFDNNIITKQMLAAKAVSADKMDVGELSAISGNLGTVTGGKIIGGVLQNQTGTFKVDANGNIVGANITGSRIDAQSIMQAGFKIKNIDVQIYKVRHGDWCPLLEGFSESQCTFVPVGYVQTESYCKSSNRAPYIPRISDDGLAPVGKSISNNEYSQQKSRWVGSCDLYFRTNRSHKVNIGIKGKRQAIAESRYLDMSTSGSDGTHPGFKDVECYSYGELYVLVIAKQ